MQDPPRAAKVTRVAEAAWARTAFRVPIQPKEGGMQTLPLARQDGQAVGMPCGKGESMPGKRRAGT